MSKKIFPFVLVLLPFVASSQAIEVTKETSRIEGKNMTGYQVEIPATEKQASNSLAKYLKALGKTKQSGDYITVAEPVVAGKKYAGTLYATTRGTGKATAAWISIATIEEESAGHDAELKKLVHDFGVTFRREQIQAQIDESNRALQAVIRQQARLVNQDEDLNTRIENNKREKIQLEKSLLENKVELETLVKKLEANKKAQDSVAVAEAQIKKVVEMHKAEQSRVH